MIIAFVFCLAIYFGKKRKSAKKENSEFGYEEEDGTGKSILFLKMTGTPEKPIITYDTQGLKQKWKEDAKTEKQTLKQILNKEFGWFKKDTTLIETPATQKKAFCYRMGKRRTQREK